MNLQPLFEDDEVKIKKINVYALFRDSEKHIGRALNQLANLTSLDNLEFSFFFYANDCRDNTYKVLVDWCALHNGKVLYEELNAPKFGSVESSQRCAMLAYYRNKNKEMGRENPSDYSLVVDSDLVWGNSDFNALLDFMEESQHFTMATSNCRQNIADLTFGEAEDSFYDIYCFRDKNGMGGTYFADTPFYRKEDKENFQNLRPVEVNSAFGGLALIDSYAFDQEQWTSFGESEHVALCGSLRPYGRIAIVPTSRPVAEVDLKTINIEACKDIAKQQKQRWIAGNKLDEMSRDGEFKFIRKQ